MLNIPIVPAVTKGFHFEGVAAHQTRQALAEEIRTLLLDMRKQTVIPSYQEQFTKFIEAINPGSVRPFYRLPYPSSNPNDLRGQTKIAAVYAKLSWLIQLFWDTVLDGKDNADLIRRYLTELRQVSTYGIDCCRLSGDERHGWFLEVPDNG